jgi:membrane-associated phospholipid phosphatase
MNSSIIHKYSKLKPSLFLLPLGLLLALLVALYSQHALSVAQYVAIQKNYFLNINATLSQFPVLIYNLTQLGDALIFLSLLSLFVIYAPKLWEALLSASLVSAIFSNVLKNLFAVPRPAAMFDPTSFTIIGKTLTGHNSLPSGHSITVFTILTVVLFSFMPTKLPRKMLWTAFIILTGLLLVFTRVGVGAHYPLDVLTGSVIGYISGLAGLFISRKYKLWVWISNKKFYPIFMVLFLICFIVITTKVSHEPLLIFYLTLVSLAVSLYKIIYVYVKK